MRCPRSLCAVCVLIALAPRPRAVAAAEDSVAAVCSRALDAYAELEFRLARKLYRRALAIAEEAHSTDAQPMATALVGLAAVELATQGDRPQAMDYVRRAVRVAPDLELPPPLATDEVQRMWRDASAQVLDSVPEAGPSGASARAAAVAARQQRNVPATGTHEQNDKDDDEEDDENPLLRRATSSGPQHGATGWWFGLGLGTGVGYAHGAGAESRADLQGRNVSGFAHAALGHVVPALGYQLTEGFSLSLRGRHQWLGQRDTRLARGANLALIEARWFTSPARLRLFGSVLAGGGEGFRFLIVAANDATVRDTVRAGSFAAGLGAGVLYEMTAALALVVEANGLAGFPLPGAVLDVNVGLQLQP